MNEEEALSEKLAIIKEHERIRKAEETIIRYCPRRDIKCSECCCFEYFHFYQDHYCEWCSFLEIDISGVWVSPWHKENRWW